MGPTTEMHTLPVFDENGIQIGFQQVNRLISQTQPTGNLVKSQPNIHPSQPASDSLHPNSKNWTSIPLIDLSNPAALTTFIPLDPQPLSVCELDQGVIATLLGNLQGGEWDPWPNGRFRLDLTHTEYMATKRLAVQWATKSNTTRSRNSSVGSSTIAGGKILNKKCLGVLICTVEGCQFIGRPQVESAGLQKQLSARCYCGGQLKHDHCSSRSYLITWGQQDGDISTTQYRYINGTAHTHSRLPGVVRTTAAEDQRFRTVYENRPNATSTQLMVGAPAPQGFGPSAADLGQKFSQRAYTSYRLNQEKKKDGNGPTSAFGNLQNLQKWKGKHSTVPCKDYVSSDIVCISLQTEWMQQQTLPDMSDVGDPLHGLLSDAAHKYWEDPNGRLIVTSIYSPLIEKWVPVLFTYANGATIAHYEYHFLILIEGIAATVTKRQRRCD
ncbi:uncharacterized protein C8R40DRAFT_1237469 [Lentinula edodes]|uniref:uncharacterized protein n=1 Tax=Lentinula edodes TaxID=5353 RepID=UPI001E8EEF78|nr:uncharacterized protein C8R40DRAFT_1237469 [Lentinula edodes]KAH7874864.1 hypothetical protein C8R40DRAFT_1237469 [Lentinula edodes]